MTALNAVKKLRAWSSSQQHTKAAAAHDKKGEAAFNSAKKSKASRSVVNALRAVRSSSHKSHTSHSPPEQTNLRGSMTLLSKCRIKAHATGNGNFPFSGVAYTGGVFYPTVTIGDRVETGPYILDLDTLVIPSRNRPVLDNHDETTNGVIGKTTMFAVRKPGYTLPVKGIIYGTADSAEKYLRPAAAGHQWQMSVGTDGFTIQRVPAGQSVRVNNRNFQGPVTVCRNAYLTDVSLVVKGADDQTTCTIAASRAGCAHHPERKPPKHKPGKTAK